MIQGSLYYQPKQGTVRWEIPQNLHIFASSLILHQNGLPFNDPCYMGISKNRGSPKSSILIGIFYYKPSIFRFSPYFLVDTHMVTTTTLQLPHQRVHQLHPPPLAPQRSGRASARSGETSLGVPHDCWDWGYPPGNFSRYDAAFLERKTTTSSKSDLEESILVSEKFLSSPML